MSWSIVFHIMKKRGLERVTTKGERLKMEPHFEVINAQLVTA